MERMKNQPETNVRQRRAATIEALEGMYTFHSRADELRNVRLEKGIYVPTVEAKGRDKSVKVPKVYEF